MPVDLSTSIKLNTGATMPILGFGTWKSPPGQVEKAVEIALRDAGFRSIDTATAYGNEKEVGIGIKKSGVPRDQIFLTTKLNNDDHKRVKEALDYSLAQLDTPYLDLWLMHWPAPMISPPSLGVADKSIDWVDTWKEMENVYLANKDKVRAIGVSNISVKFLDRLFKVARVVPAMNQIELHPSLPQTSVVEESIKRGIALTAYSPLGSNESPLMTNEIILGIAKKHDVGPANVLISFQAAHADRTVVSKSVTPERIIANAKTIDLTPEEFKAIASIGDTHKFRVCNPNWAGWGGLGFEEYDDDEAK